jgi:glycosyltransferase involved in cell wall biosynthesis
MASLCKHFAMDSRLLLSIALASYNGERYIGEQLDSIARQTRLPDELIVSDDASSDRTRAIVRDFARHVPFAVRLLTNPNRTGSTCNFEIAIRACSGDVIFLCDQDDFWYENKIALIEDRFISSPKTSVVFTDGDVVDENLRPIGSRLWETFRFNPIEQRQVAACGTFDVLLRHPIVTGATMAFRSTCRDLILPLANTWHDAWISLLVAATSCLDALPTPLIAYRQHGANQVGIPRRGGSRGKSHAEIYGARILLYEAARERLLQFDGGVSTSEQKIHRLDEALSFLHFRTVLPKAWWRRLPGAIRALVAGHYHRYGYGWRTFIKDLVR